MGGHRKQTASLKVPAKALRVLKKRSSNARTSSADEGPNRTKTENKGRQSAFKPKSFPQQRHLAKMQSAYCTPYFKGSICL